MADKPNTTGSQKLTSDEIRRIAQGIKDDIDIGEIETPVGMVQAFENALVRARNKMVLLGHG